MGLFFHEKGAEARGPAKASLRLRKEEKALLNCGQCPLDKAALFSPKMLPSGAPRPVLYFLGEAPGRREDEAGKQFVGESGQIIRTLIPPAWRDKIRWSNTLRCKTPGNRDPSGLELACCERLLISDLEATKPQAVVSFGNIPLQALLGSDRQIGAWRGRRAPIKIGAHRCWLYPMLHPAALLHQRTSKDYNERQKADITRLFFERELHQVFIDAEQGLPPAEVEEDFLRGVRSLQHRGSKGLAEIETWLLKFRDREHSIDIETSGLRPYGPDSRILSVAIGDYEEVMAFPWEHRESPWSPSEKRLIGEMLAHYLAGSGRKWAHHSAFEQEWFYARFGGKAIFESDWGCTLGQAHILDERPKLKSLDDLTQLHFGFRLKEQSAVDVARLDEFSLDEVLPYNGMDVKYCFALAMLQREELERQGLKACFEERNLEIRSLVAIQARGLVRDEKQIEILNDELEKEEDRLRREILNSKQAGQFQSRTGKPLNPASNPDVLKLFGIESSTEEALSALHNPLADLILDLRSATKRKGYITPLLPGGKFVHGDGLVHAKYSNFITSTARLSSEDPNAQNYPRRKHKEIRRAIGCPPGHLFAAFDYGQLEARIVAAISKDPTLIKEIKAGQDIHGDWTDAIGGHFIPKRLKAERKKIRDGIKQMWTFALFFGNVLEAVANDLSRELDARISPEELEPFFLDFWERYNGVRKWQLRLLAQYKKQGYIETARGQRRRGPMKVQEVINQPVQGSAAHVVIDAQHRLCMKSYEEDRPEITPILNVHDDLSFYFPVDRAEELIEVVAREMVCSPLDFVCVPLSVEVSIGENWCDKEEIGTFTTEDFK